MARADAAAGGDKLTQCLVTFVLGGAVSFYMWPYLTSESKGMVAVFGVIAALSIHLSLIHI